MSAALLYELKKLQHQRSDSSPFSNHVEFQTWADKVLPLLSFDQKLYNRFRSIVLATNSARVLDSKKQETENINTAIGILNQAITSLEIVAVPNTAGKPSDKELPRSIESQDKPNLLQRPIGYLGITILGGVVILLIGYLIKTHLGLPL